MKEEIDDFIEQQKLTLFSSAGIVLLPKEQIFKTREARSIYTKILNLINRHFAFKNTSRLLELLVPAITSEQIEMRSSFFMTVKPQAKVSLLAQIEEPNPTWKEPYSFVVVALEEDYYNELRRSKTSVILAETERDLRELSGYDVVKVIGESSLVAQFEEFDNVISVRNVAECSLESHLRLLSAWKKNLLLLQENVEMFSSLGLREEIEASIAPLIKLLSLLEMTN